MPPPTTTTRGAVAGSDGGTGHRFAKTWSPGPPEGNHRAMGCVTVASPPVSAAGRGPSRTGMQMTRSTHRTALAALAATALLGLAACSGSSSDSMATSDTAAGSAGSGQAAGDLAEKQPRPARTALRAKAVIKTGEIAVTSRHLTRVRAEVDRLLASVGGSVDREETTNARDGSIDRSRLVLRVPVEKFDESKRAIGRLGKLTSSTESEKDVTTEVIDTDERVQTLQNSLDRLQRYQRSAKDVSALIRYEDQITARQSELQSLTAQQTYLTSRTTMSTITLDLSTPETYVAPPGALDDAGFLAGLEGGWHALGAVVVVALTVLGAALPFLVVSGLVGVPLWLGVRLLVRRRAVTD